MAFISDFRKTNPKLHALYVYWAMQTIRDYNKARELLFGNTFQRAFLVGALQVEMSKLILEDAAYHDASAFIFAGINPEDKNPEHLLTNPTD
jgi:hypothetical protein